MRKFLAAARIVVAVLTPASLSRPLNGGEVTVSVDAVKVINTMRGGLGASWHAIEEPIPYRSGQSEGGSAWGANPPAADDAAWKQLCEHADWLGLDWCRVEVEQRMYEPERGRFEFDNAEMRILYRILDWCQRRGVDVFFQQMWGNVSWNAFPEWREDPARRVHSGPASLDAYAAGLAALMEHLLKIKGYACIRWLSITNEPGHGWSWWIEPPQKPMPLAPGLAAVRTALERRGLTIPLAGPDWTDLPALEPEKIDFDPLVGAYDLHSYWANFDGREGGYPLAEAEKRLAAWAGWAHARGKPFFLSELGTMAFGWKDDHPGPGSYPSALKDAELVIRGLNAGVDAFNRWSFVNRGDLDGQWQLVDTWDRSAKKLLPRFSPHPNAYFVFGLLARFTAKRSEVLRCEVAGGSLENRQRVFATALRSPRGNLTLLALNDAESEWDGAFSVGGLSRPIALHRHRITAAQADRIDLAVESEKTFNLSPQTEPRFTDRLPGSSLTVYTTYRLGHGQAGVAADGAP